MRSTILMTTLTIVALVATACGGPAASPAPAKPNEPPAAGKNDLAGTSWTLTTLNGQPALTGTTVTLNFIANTAAGSDGCNNYSTTYTADGSTIQFKEPIAATMMACPDPIMKQATDYLKALGQAATYQLSGTQLTLADANGKELAVFAAQSNDLSGTSWTVISYNNGKQAVVSVMANTTLTANFGADGQLAGSAGCNTYNATYETSGQNIKIGPPATTRMACEQAVMDQEAQYLAALQTAATYRIDGTKLEMRTADGALAATFQKAASGSEGLSGASWNVISYNNGKQAVVSVMANTTLTANFGADDQLSGSSGCNTYNATYETSGQTIKIGPPATTRMACEQAVMDQEMQYLAALQTAATYRIDGTQLEMRTADGALAATFQKTTMGQ